MNKLSFFLSLLIAVVLSFSSCAGNKSRPEADGSDDDVQEILESKKANDYIGSGPLGTKTNPIKCEGFSGAKDYLMRLQDFGGKAVEFTEVGGAGLSPFGGTATVYNVKANGQDYQLYFDTTFDGYNETKSPQGLKITP